MNTAGRVKSYTVLSLAELLSVVELLKLSLKGERCLLVLEGLGVLFLAQKVALLHIIVYRSNNFILRPSQSITGNLLPSSLIHAVLKSLHDLGQAQYVVSLWVCSGVRGDVAVTAPPSCPHTKRLSVLHIALPKLSGGLREGAYRDPVTVLWKQKMVKVVHYSFAG